MPFPDALNAGELAMVRQDNCFFKQYLLLTPNDVIWQTQPADAVDGSLPYARFEWDGTDQGDRANVKEGQTVLITTSDTDLSTLIYRGRVRKVPDATYFYINENSTNLTAAYFVTVINDWDIHEKLERRTAAGDEYKDYDLTWEEIPPRITNLQSVYVSDSSDAVVYFDFTPTADAGASGAAVTTWLWDIADGAFIVGNANTQIIMAEFPGAATNEHRWVTLTITDDNGVSNYFVFEVYTIDTTVTVSDVIAFDAGDLAITGTIGEGWNATVRGWAGIDDVLDRTRCAIYSRDYYNGVRILDFFGGGFYAVAAGDTITGHTSGATAVVVEVVITSGSWVNGDATGQMFVNQITGVFEVETIDVGLNIDVANLQGPPNWYYITSDVIFVGRLRTERSLTRGDEIHAVLQDTTFNIEGFGTQLGRLVGPGLHLQDTAAPDEWGEIQDLTIKRAILYMLAWHSTFLNVSSLTFDASSDDYRWDEFVIREASLQEWVNNTADDQNAYIVYAPAGESTIQRHASYTGVGGLTTVMTIEVDDAGLSDLIAFTLEREYVETYAQAICGAATYNTTTDKATTYIGKAPSQSYGPGWENAPLDNQIMKVNLSDADAITEVKLRTSSHYAYMNPHPRLTGVQVMSGLYWLVPMVHRLYAFDIEATDTTRALAYTSANKWILTELTYTFSHETGVCDVTGNFEIVTTGGNAGIAVTQVPDVNDLGYPPLPPYGADGPINPLINYPVDNPDFTLPGDGDWGLDQPEPPQPGPPIGCEQVSVSMRDDQNYATVNLAQNAETYIITVEGDGLIGTNGGPPAFVDFTNATKYTFIVVPDRPGANLSILDNSFGNPLPSTVNNGYGTNPDGKDLASCCIRIDFASAVTVDSVSFDWYYEDPLGNNQIGIEYFLYDSGDNLLANVSIGPTVATDTWHNQLWTGIGQATVSWAAVAVWRADTVGRITCWMDNVSIGTTGTSDVYGDAFYHSYNLGEGQYALYGAGKGFLIDLAKPAGIPMYNPSHRYTLVYTGSNAFIGLRYTDEAGDYTDNQNRHLLVTVCGPGMGSVAI